jgi:hypothetical protein
MRGHPKTRGTVKLVADSVEGEWSKGDEDVREAVKVAVSILSYRSIRKFSISDWLKLYELDLADQIYLEFYTSFTRILTRGKDVHHGQCFCRKYAADLSLPNGMLRSVRPSRS